MIAVLNSMLLVVLVFIIVQDLKFRAIHVALPVVLAVTGVIRFFIMEHPYFQLIGSLQLLLIILLGLFLYVSIKSKRLVNPVDKSIGLGDIVYFVAIIPLFYSSTFILFFITGMIFSLLCHFVLARWEKGGIPLAGYLSIYLIGLLLFDQFMAKDLLLTHIF